MTTKKPSQTRKPVRENRSRLSRLIEQNLENVEIVLGVRGAIIDKLQNMAEDLAKIEPDDLMPMSDSLKTAFGPDMASHFSAAVTGKLRELVTAISSAKDEIGNEISRLESAANGEPVNDMGMDDAEGGDGMGGDEMPTGGDDMGGEGMEGDEGEMPADDMGDQGETDLNELPPLGDDEKTNAAGRAKKEGAVRRGRRLVEYTSASFDANMHNLSAFDPRAGTIALSIHDLIDKGRFDGNERAGLANVLSHLAAFAPDARHWEDPDAKVEAALSQARVDTRLPEVRGIVAKLKKLAHMISLKHDGMMESKKISRNIRSLRESKNPDALVLKEFRRVLSETKNPTRSVRMVAEKFAIDVSDVVQIVREAKKVVKETPAMARKIRDEKWEREKANKGSEEKWEKEHGKKVAPEKSDRGSVKVGEAIQHSASQTARMDKTLRDEKYARMALRDAGIRGQIFGGCVTVSSEEDKKKARAAGIRLPIDVKESVKKKSVKVNELRSKVARLESAVRKGRVKESAIRWMDVVESDLPYEKTIDKKDGFDKEFGKTRKPAKKIAEQVPLKPKSPADMHADRDAAAQAVAQPQQGAPQGKAQGNAQGNAPTQQAPNAQGFAPFQKGAQGRPQGTPQQTVQPGQKPQSQPQQAAGQGQAPMIPSTMKQTTAVGSSPTKEPEMPKLPGKEMKTVPSMNNAIPPITLMSKPTPFPAPGKPLMNTGGQSGQSQVSEKRTRR